MTDYAVKVGLNQALLDLVAMTPQPRSTGVQAVDRTHSASGAVYEGAQYIELKWDMLETATDYATLLAQFGLSSALFAEVTIYARDSRWAWARYNGIAVLPEMGADARWEDYYPRQITVLVKALEAVA